MNAIVQGRTLARQPTEATAIGDSPPRDEACAEHPADHHDFSSWFQEATMSAPHDESVGPATGHGTVDRPATRPSGWVVGMVLFTATMMIVIGLFQALSGLVALFRNEIYVVARDTCSHPISRRGDGFIC